MTTSKNMEQRNLEFQHITIKTLAQIHGKICELSALNSTDQTDHPITSVLNNLLRLEAAEIDTQEKIIELLKAHQNLLVENEKDNQRIKKSIYYLGIALKQLSDQLENFIRDQK